MWKYKCWIQVDTEGSAGLENDFLICVFLGCCLSRMIFFLCVFVYGGGGEVYSNYFVSGIINYCILISKCTYKTKFNIDFIYLTLLRI